MYSVLQIMKDQQWIVCLIVSLKQLIVTTSHWATNGTVAQLEVTFLSFRDQELFISQAVTTIFAPFKSLNQELFIYLLSVTK